MNRDLSQKIREWRKKIGYTMALQALLKQGLSRSLAQKLLAQTYPGEPRGLYLQALERAMKLELKK